MPVTKNKILDLSIIIPVYNEEKNIELTLISLKKNVSVKHEIIVVYDNDNDTTLPILRKLSPKYPNVTVVRNNIHPGPSGAIRTGITKAIAPRILVAMADLCDDLSQIDKLINIVPKYADIAVPSRYAKGGRQELDAPIKVGLPRIAGALLKLLTNLPTSDPTNSYKMYSSNLFKTFSLTSKLSFSVTLEIVAKAHCLGFKIKEIPTVWKDRQHGKTNFKLLSSLAGYTPWFLLALFRNRLFRLNHSLLKKFLVHI